MPKKTTIYIFGNELLDFDNLPLKLAPKLKKLFPDINFIIQDPNENLKFTRRIRQSGGVGGPDMVDKLIIIDTVMGIKNIAVICDIKKLETEKIYSMHDFDLAFNLKLLKKIGRLGKLTILGVPPDYSEKKALRELKKIIGKNHFQFTFKKCEAQDMQGS